MEASTSPPSLVSDEMAGTTVSDSGGNDSDSTIIAPTPTAIIMHADQTPDTSSSQYTRPKIPLYRHKRSMDIASEYTINSSMSRISQSQAGVAAHGGANVATIHQQYFGYQPPEAPSVVDDKWETYSDTISTLFSYTKEKKTNTTHTFINICKCFAGAASFELPWSLSQSGSVLGGVSLVVLAVVTRFTLQWLAECGHYHPYIRKPTYPSLAQHAFGRGGYLLAWFGIIAMTVGVCGSYLVFIGSEVSVMIAYHFHGRDTRFLTESVCTLLLTMPIIVLSWFRSYRFLVPCAQMGLLALIFALVVTIAQSVRNMDDDGHGNNSDRGGVKYVNLSDYPLFLGNAAFLYLIHSVVLPIEQGMEDRPRYQLTAGYKTALNRAIVCVTILNLVFAELVYYAFGNSICGNVIDNLTDGWLKSLVRILLCLDLFFTYALFLFPMTESLERTLFAEEQFGTFRTEFLRNAIRAALVLSTCGIALLVPNFEQLTGLTGAFGNNMLGLILPPLMFLKLRKERQVGVSAAERAIAYATSSFGVAMLVVCTYFFVDAIINAEHDAKC